MKATAETTVGRLHPLAVAEAVRLSGSNASRVRIIDTRTVLILNFPGQSWPVRRKPRKARA